MSESDTLLHIQERKFVWRKKQNQLIMRIFVQNKSIVMRIRDIAVDELEAESDPVTEDM